MRENGDAVKCYLGLDAGTQSLKAVLINAAAGEVVASASVNFGRELPQYQSPNGFVPDSDPTVRQADPLMWLDALDLVLEKLSNAGAPLQLVAGISGSGQQHGSVYLNGRFAPIIGALDPERPLSGQLAPALSRRLAPIWMDHSTTPECAELTARFGERLRNETGSPAIERFTAAQIRRFARIDPEGWNATAAVHLVSSFLGSVLCGAALPVDCGDGAGMNLLDLSTRKFDPLIAEFCAPGLAGRLPEVVPDDRIVGGSAPYFARYGIPTGTPVVVFSGDNPNSLIGVGGGRPGVAVVSLGTSDTFFAAMPDFRTDPDGCGHVFGNPAGGFMSLICFANGSLARDTVRRQCGADWDFFDRTALELTAPGNGGRLMLPYFVPECTPPVGTAGAVYNFDAGAAAPAELIRAVLESQALRMRLHSQWQGETFRRLRITGGASGSVGFRQILADVFEATVESIAVADSAALGAALRAAAAIGDTAFEELWEKFCSPVETVAPRAGTAPVYRRALREFAVLERSVS